MSAVDQICFFELICTVNYSSQTPIIRHRHHVETAMFVNIKSCNLDSHIFAIKEATFAKKVSLYSASNYLIISADERCQNGRHVVEKAEKMQKKTEKLLFH